jgi:hypothetical protein
MMQFKAFKPEAMNKIAKTMGYQGDMGQFQNFIEQDPARQQQMNMYTNAAKMMAQGGMVRKFDDGGFNPTFYRVPVGPTGPEQQTKKIYIGSEQDTRANRILGSSDLASAVQDAGPGFLRANPPYDERPDTQQAVQEQQPTPLQSYAERFPVATEGAIEQVVAMMQQQAANQQNYSMAVAMAQQNNSPMPNPADYGLPDPTAPSDPKASPGYISPYSPPNYNEFLKSPEYSATQGMAGAAVIAPIEIDGVTYKGPNPVQADAYTKY